MAPGNTPRARRPTAAAVLHLLLSAVVVALAVPVVAAAPAITSGSCARNGDGWCINNTITLQGSGLASTASVAIGATAADQQLITCTSGFTASNTSITCTVSMAASATAGLYPVTLVQSDGTSVQGGSVLVGALYEQTQLPFWSSTTPSSPYVVTGQSSDWPSTGDLWSVTGTFDPSATYTVSFYNNQPMAAAGNPSPPTCSPVTVSATALSCNIASANGVMGMFNFVVQDTASSALLLGSTALYSIAVNPPLPDVTAGSMQCAAGASSSSTTTRSLTLSSVRAILATEGDAETSSNSLVTQAASSSSSSAIGIHDASSSSSSAIGIHDASSSSSSAIGIHDASSSSSAVDTHDTSSSSSSDTTTCASGASITFTGTNFNYRNPAFQKLFVGVTAAQRSAVTLAPTAVDKTGLTATLTVAAGTPAGTYPVFVEVQVCDDGMMTPLYYIGSIVIDAGGTAGFDLNGAASLGPTVVSGFCYDGDDLCRSNIVTLTGTGLSSVKSVLVGATAAEQQLIPCSGVTATDRTVSCTLAMGATASDGVYPVTLVQSDDTTAPAGSLAVGTFLEARVPVWSSTTPSSPYVVTGQSSDWPSTGDLWSVTGTFDPSATYTVSFYNNQPMAAAGNPSPPTCSPVTVSATALSCHIASANGVMGMFNFVVQDTASGALLLGSTALYSIAVNPPLPDVTGATGSCATSSASCASGASITFTGTNFNYRDPAFQKLFVGVTAAQRSAVTLAPTAVDKAGLTATLTVAAGTRAGSYPVFVEVQVCYMGMMTPMRYMGNLVLNSGAAAGFNTEQMNATVEEEPATVIENTNTGGYKAAVAFAVIFAVLFAVLGVVLIVLRCRFDLISKKHRQREFFFEHGGAEMNANIPPTNQYDNLDDRRVY